MISAQGVAAPHAARRQRLEFTGAPFERFRTDVRAEVTRPDGSFERRRATLSAWRVSLPWMALWQVLLVAAGGLLYAGGGKEALVAVAQWLRAAAGM
jgi:hypothetical protein